MEKIKQHFEEEAKEFDQIILRLIPYYPAMIEALVAAIPFDKSTPVKVIDLGLRRNVSQEEIDNKWIPKYHEEDRPAKLFDQLTWLKEIGFAEVDVIWKYYNFAVYGGMKLFNV